MVNRPPEFCPYCGTELAAVDPPTVHRCDACEEYVFHNPIPTPRLAVLDSEERSSSDSAATPHDGDAILLVKVDLPDRDLWGTPGGMVEAGEDPDVAGARELEEETTLRVDPDDLVLFDARTFAKFGEVQKTCLCYAVDAADVAGTPEADDEVAEARFWTPDELADADDRLLTSWPEDYKDLQWWVDNARAALDSASEGASVVRIIRGQIISVIERVPWTMSERVEDETTVNDSYSVTVPAAVRREAGIEAGDKLRWTVDEDGHVSVAVVEQRYGAFSDLEPVDVGSETHAAEDHDLVAREN